MVLSRVGAPLELRGVPRPVPEDGQVLLEVSAFGICRTDLHLLDGEVRIARFLRIFGHQVVGRVVGTQERVGVPWLGWTCGTCSMCVGERENLCPRARFTGCVIDGGMAEYAVADRRFCFAIPEEFGCAA